MISRYSIILVVGLVAVATTFSFSPQHTTKQCNIQSHSALPMQSNDNEYNTRRNFLTKVVATTITPILLSSTQASAAVGKCCAYLYVPCCNTISIFISYMLLVLSLYHIHASLMYNMCSLLTISYTISIYHIILHASRVYLYLSIIS